MKIENIIGKDCFWQGCLTKDVIPLFYKSILHPAGRSACLNPVQNHA